MKRWFIAAALSTSLGSLGTVALADSAPTFSDAACPQANDSGRKLNALNAAGNVSGDDLMAASQGLVDAYKDCVSSFDHTQNMKNGDHQSDYIPVNRVYSRLQLARAYQRIGSFDEQLHRPEQAKIQYDAALQPLSEIANIVSGLNVGLADRSSPEFRLQAEGQTLHDQIVASEAKLATSPASPAPSQTKP